MWFTDELDQLARSAGKNAIALEGPVALSFLKPTLRSLLGLELD